MARYGQKLLRQLTFQYCDRMGCSVGMREYIQTALPGFQQRHPDVKVVTVMRRNQFPLVKAEYDLLPNDAAHLGRILMRQQQQQQHPQQQQLQQQPLQKQQEPRRLNSNVIGVKQRSAADIRGVVWWLTQSQCRPRTRRIPAKHMVSKQPSIQGAWNATTF